MLQRQTPPPFKTIDRIDVIQPTRQELRNGIPLYQLSAGSQEISKIEFIFKAGMYQQPDTLIASTTSALMESGTKSFSANQISDGIDFYGSFLELQVEQDYATVTVYSLNKYLRPTLRFVEEILKSPSFPQHEFDIHISNKRQKHAINSQKVSVLARRRFTEMLFGAEHPYGRAVSDADFERISIGEVRAFFQRHYNHRNCTILAAGNLPSDLREILDEFIGDAWGDVSAPVFDQPLIPTTAAEKKQLVKKDDALQSAIRIGRLLFNKKHPDYFKFQFLNTLYGGYFGSRLMANIREDKGYTYGIGSGLTNLAHAGYFFISTEVGAEVTSATIAETYSEMKRLREELVPDNEMETVRNYILGNFLRSVDGPFALAEKFRSIWEFGLDYSFFDNYLHAVKTVTAKEIRDLANRYLREEDMVECVAGLR